MNEVNRDYGSILYMNELNPGYEELLTSLNAIQTELRVPKSQRNKYGNYNFRNCDDIVEAVKPLLKKYHLVLIMYDKIECINNHSYVQATASLIDTKGHELKVQHTLEKSKNLQES
jgi:hypothetical protein